VARPSCRSCGSQEIVANGKRKTLNGATQTWLCRACGYRYTCPKGYQNKRSNPKTVGLALDLYFRGLSVRKVADHLAQIHGLKVGHGTVHRWLVHYGGLESDALFI
jgi:transposase-like protein